MKQIGSIGFGAVLAAAYAIAPPAVAGVESSKAAVAGLTSRQPAGVVSIMSDPALAEGRLVLKVVAFNSTSAPVAFGPGDINVSTMSGTSVGLIPLEQLIAEAQSAVGPQGEDRQVAMGHDPNNYGYRHLPHDGVGGSGALDVAGYSGAATPTSGVISPHTHATPSGGTGGDDAALQVQIANLNAAILQPMSIAPASAAGGQIVTEKLKFSREDHRALRVQVRFNGEQHEFTFTAPPAH